MKKCHNKFNKINKLIFHNKIFFKAFYNNKYINLVMHSLHQIINIYNKIIVCPNLYLFRISLSKKVFVPNLMINKMVKFYSKTNLNKNNKVHKYKINQNSISI